MMRYIKILSIIIQTALYLATLALAVIWLFSINVPFDAEAGTFILLGLISPSISYLIKSYSKKINIEKFSIANALAYGYINNFIEPVLTQLIASGQSPKMYIYMPEKICELDRNNVTRIKATISNQWKNVKTNTIKLHEGRGARDVMTLISHDGTNRYFDIPNTLLTLTPLIDFQINSPRNNLCETEKNKLGADYITKFKETCIGLLKEKGLEDHVKLIDKNLNFK